MKIYIDFNLPPFYLCMIATCRLLIKKHYMEFLFWKFSIYNLSFFAFESWTARRCRFPNLWTSKLFFALQPLKDTSQIWQQYVFVILSCLRNVFNCGFADVLSVGENMSCCDKNQLELWANLSILQKKILHKWHPGHYKHMYNVTTSRRMIRVYMTEKLFAYSELQFYLSISQLLTVDSSIICLWLLTLRYSVLQWWAVVLSSVLHTRWI